jgi:5'-deoxynucleotidase YfbR-like HD superfamily hydrolase
MNQELEKLYSGSRIIRTFSGKYLDVFDPNPDDIVIEDIAHALSNQCRFGGHIKRFYSVAQHSVFCSDLASPKMRLQALMHDASEAFLVDIPSPIKAELCNYKEIEHNLMLVISKKFGFDFPMDDEVKEIDKYALETEWVNLMVNDNPDFASLSPWESKINFIATFEQIKNTIHG